MVHWRTHRLPMMAALSIGPAKTKGPRVRALACWCPGEGSNLYTDLPGDQQGSIAYVSGGVDVQCTAPDLLQTLEGGAVGTSL